MKEEITQQKPILQPCWNKINKKKWIIMWTDLIDAIDEGTFGNYLTMISDGSSNIIMRTSDFYAEYSRHEI